MNDDDDDNVLEIVPPLGDGADQGCPVDCSDNVIVLVDDTTNIEREQDDHDDVHEGVNQDAAVQEINFAMENVDFIDLNHEMGMEKIRNFVCDCHKRRKNPKPGDVSCSAKIPAEVIHKRRVEMCGLTSNEKDMMVLGMISSMANMGATTERKKQKPTERQHQKTTYHVEGKQVCRNTFLFIYM